MEESAQLTMTAEQQLWEEIAATIRPQVSADTFQRWFREIELADLDAEQFTLRVPNKIYQFWIESNYLPLLQAAAAPVFGGAIREVRFVLGKPEPATPPKARATEPVEREKKMAARSMEPATPKVEEVIPAPVVLTPEEIAAQEAKLDATTTDTPGLNPRNTFDTYVVGTSNQFASAACKAVSEAPARTYNPLFIYGGVGLGKTHLMHAIGHRIQAKKKSKVCYLTSEQFTNEFIDAIQNGTLVKFRRRYRQVDVLLIDDIQFLSGKERSQEEFFHTFNALFDGHKQIVLSSDRPPAEIQNLEARLVSRFEWGLTAELAAPDTETRQAILRKKAESLHVKVPPDIIEFLASRIRTNVRRLEGALMRVASFISLNSGVAPTGLQLEGLLKDLLQEEARRVISIDQIKTRIAEHFDVRLADMTSKRRPANIAFPRQVAMYFARELTKSSLCEIGEAFGGRDHGTVIHAHKLVKERINKDPGIRQIIARLDAEFQR